ncbi:MAG: WhiB family transcriptional regulator [Propionibacteriaceae bacterium]|jgi:WhiB family redox-sensing transcriptional regulator|nr:WhiB family transcriptional regulator [Propionibacteriaceae bacterium]
MSLLEAENWMVHAKCKGTNDEMFPEGSAQKKARNVCQGCKVRLECLAEALDNQIEWGVWGGMTERERRQLLKRRPRVTSWYEVFANKDAYGVVPTR